MKEYRLMLIETIPSRKRNLSGFFRQSPKSNFLDLIQFYPIITSSSHSSTTQHFNKRRMPSATGIPQGQREARIHSHSHIKGLGLDDDGFAQNNRGGFVGQRAAREVNLPSLSPTVPL